MNRGAWWVTVHRVANSWTQLRDGVHVRTHGVRIRLPNLYKL